MTQIANRPVLNGADLDAAIEHARAALAAVLRSPAGGDRVAFPAPRLGGEAGCPKVLTEARARLGALLVHRLARAAGPPAPAGPPGSPGGPGLAAIAAVRADRDEAIAVHAALLYWLPAGDPAWPDVATTVGRLSYDRYSDPWPGAEAPDPDDLDAACDLLLRSTPPDRADERTARYLVLALRDRLRLLACPADASALMTWEERLLAFPDAAGLGQAGLHDLLQPKLTDRPGAVVPSGPRAQESLPSLRLAA
jgi:hypothetical protein